MLTMLRQFAEGKPVGAGRNSEKAMAHLNSRGWVKDSHITTAGRAYLESRK
jgi:hypothetical protein